MHFIFFKGRLHFLGAEAASSLAFTREGANRKIRIFVSANFLMRERFAGVNDLIRDARARLRYEADLSFSREALEREVAAAPGNTLRLPIGGAPIGQISLLMSLAK